MGRPALATGAAGLVSTHVETLDPVSGRWVRAATAQGMGRSRWVARCRLKGADGEYRPVRATGQTRREAEAALADNLARRARAEAAAAAAADDRVTTVADTAATWLDVLEATGARPGTRDLYRRSVVAHLVPRLGMVKVRHLSAPIAERWLAEVADRSGPAAARTARNCLRGVIDVALAKGVLDEDPLRSVELPVTAAPAAAPVLTVAQAAHLLVVASADADAVRHGLADLVAVLLGSGARLGEALALRWADVDVTPGAAALRVAARLERATGRSTDVRRTADERIVPITDSLAALLQARRRRPSADVGDQALVFPTSRGTAADPAATTRRLRALFDAAGLPGVTSHALRATRAQRLLDAGVDAAEVARLLGTSRLRAGSVMTTGAVPAVAPAALIPRQRHTDGAQVPSAQRGQDAADGAADTSGASTGVFADAGASSR